MISGVLLDTSFLITLADPTRARHEVAKNYFKLLLEQRRPLILSAIVVSEFHLKQKITTLPLENFVMLPFNHDDATAAAELDFTRFKQPGRNRVALKDDFKLLGQAKARGFGFLLTDDEETLHPICNELRQAGELVTRSIKLQDGFSQAHFEPNGQHNFDGTLNEAATTYGNAIADGGGEVAAEKA